MDVTKFILRIIFKALVFLALGFATYWLYIHPEHEYHGWYIVTAIWALFAAGDIGDDLQPESRAPWNRSA
jgi:hypothetical protein